MNWCVLNGIAPAEVRDSSVRDFLAWLENHTLHPRPRAVVWSLPVIWNEARAAVSGWPGTDLSRISLRARSPNLRWEDLPVSFRSEADEYLQLRREPDVFSTDADHPRRPLAASTLDRQREHIRLKGTMNALFLKDLAQKTRRGLEGRVRQGRSGGGICYGYDLVPGDTGARRINVAEAEIVRRIFREFAAGKSPRAIARQLNMEGVPGPHGREWRDTAIRGHVTRGTGILNNQLYVGQLIWNRLTYIKDPTSGRRRSRLNPEGQHVREAVPELRIVDGTLWSAVQARASGIRESAPIRRAHKKRFWEKRRPANFLTGLVQCGVCGSGFASIGRDYLACSAARGRGTCSNTRSLRRGALEDLILSGLQHRLMAPELVEAFVTEVNLEINRQRRDDGANRAVQERELAQVSRKLAGLVEAIADGIRAPDLQRRLDELTVKRDELVRSLERPPELPIRLHPNLGQVYRRKVDGLRAALQDPTVRDEAVEVVRSLLERVIIHAGTDGPEVEIVGEIARMVELGIESRNAKKAALDERTACSVKVVAGTGLNL